jgi:cytochrome c-type biogenesis protein CcmF
MTDVGYWSLVLALAVSVYTATAFALGARQGRSKLIRSAGNGLLIVAGLVSVSAASLMYLLLTRNFQVRYVYQHVSTYLATPYTISAFWAGQEGSLLLWLWLLAILSIFVQRRAWNQELLPYALAALAASEAFLAFVLVFTSNPFATYPIRPLEGFGLNPLLENFWMIIHPPIVFIGYAAYTVPFAFALAALVTGRLGDEWVRGVRRWNLFAWLFLGLGILLGAWWAYLELGWGGYWGWDPVENSSLLPWLVGTAALHSFVVQERRGMFKVWNIILTALTFALCVFATFVTRSGIIQSVHAFGTSPVGYYFLAFIIIVLVLSLILLYRRRRELASREELEALLSREIGFLLAILIFCGMTLAILLGTLYPAITEIFRGVQVALGASFYERVMGPLAMVVVLLFGVCPFLAWRRTSAGRLWRGLCYSLFVALLLALALFAMGVREPFSLLSFTVCAFVITSIGVEFYRGVAARRRRTGENPLRALLTLIGKDRRRYGGYLVHLAIILIVFGVTGSSVYKDEWQVSLAPGERVTIKGYVLEYQGLSRERTQAKQRFAATLSVYRDGRRIAELVPEKNFHWNIEQWVTEVAIRSSLKEDLYVILAGLEEGLATFQILINPLVVWLWIGGGLLLLGTVVAIWPLSARETKIALRMIIPAVFMGLFLLFILRAEGGSVVGRMAPQFTLQLFDGGELSLKDLQGEVVVVNFWASWCAPCRQEAPALEKVWQAYKDKGVAFVGVNYRDVESKARAFLTDFGITYPNGPDVGAKIADAYRIKGVPETFLIAKDGRIANRHIGPISEKTLAELIEELLGE